MKALLIHSGYLEPNGADYVGLFSRNALRAMGHEVIELGGFHRNVSVTADIDRADRVAREERPDFILHMHGLPHPRMSGELLDALNATGIPTVLWVHNEEVDFDRTIKISPRYSLFCDYTKLTIPQHQAAGANVLYLPLGADHTIYHPVELTETDRRRYAHDLAIIGAPHLHRMKIINAIKDDYDIFMNWNLKLPNAEVNKIYNAARIMLAPCQDCDQEGSIWNPSCTIKHTRAHGCPCRTFDVPAAGGFQIQVPRPDLGDVYDLERETALADGWDKGFENGVRELRRAIDYYLAHEDERRRIAEAGRKRTIGANLYTHRMQAIIDRLRQDKLLRRKTQASVAEPLGELARRACAAHEPRNALVVGDRLLALLPALREQGVEAQGVAFATATDEGRRIFAFGDERAIPTRCDLALVDVNTRSLQREQIDSLIVALKGAARVVVARAAGEERDKAVHDMFDVMLQEAGFRPSSSSDGKVFGADDVVLVNADFPSYTFLLPVRPVTREARDVIRWANNLVELGSRVEVVDLRLDGERPTELHAGARYRRNDLASAPSCRRLPDADYLIAASWDTAERIAGCPLEKGAKFHWVMRGEANETEEPDAYDKALRLNPIKLVVSEKLRDQISVKCQTPPALMPIPRDLGSARAVGKILAAAVEEASQHKYRILYVTAGYMWVDCYLDHCLIRGFRDLGHQVDVFPLCPESNAETLGLRLDALTPEYRENYRRKVGEPPERIFEWLRRGRYDMVFFLHGWLFPASALLRIREMGVPTVAWFTEEPYELRVSIERSRLFDYIFLQDRSTEEQHRRLSNPRAYYLPHGFAPELHKPVMETPPRYLSDVCIIGTAFPRRKSLVRALARDGVDVLAVGRGWKGLQKDGVRVVEKVVTLEESNLYVNGAKINLTVHRGARDLDSGEHFVKPTSPNATAYFIAGAGGFQISDSTRPDLARHFEAEREIVFFSDENDLRRKTRYYLDHPGERERIAAAGHARAMRCHKYSHRLAEMLRLLGAPVGHRAEFTVSAFNRANIRQAVSIVIPAYNALDYLRNCLISIRECADMPYEIMVVNNGSTDGTAEWLDAEKIPHVDNLTNRGYGAAINQAIRLAHGDYIAILNSDLMLSKNWLSRMMKYMDDPSVGIVGPSTNYVSGQQLTPSDYGEDLDKYAAFVRAQYGRCAGRGREVDRLVGFAMLARRAVFESVGIFDERFGVGNYEDDDLCLRAKIGGWKLIWARDVFIHHFGSRSFASNEARESGIDYEKLMTRNATLFQRKWGFAADAMTKYGPRAKIQVSPPELAPAPVFRSVAESAEISAPPAPSAPIQAEISETRVVISGGAEYKGAPTTGDGTGALVALLELAQTQLQAGDSVAAIATLRQAAAAVPDCDAVFNNLGAACAAAGDWRAAATSFRRAVQLNENNVIAKHNLADAAFAAGDYACCMDACEKLIRANPADHEALLVLANAYLRLGAYDSALLGYETLLKMRPDCEDARVNLAEARRAARRAAGQEAWQA